MKDNNTLVPIPVPGTDRQIMAVDLDGKPHVSLRHACDAIGVAFDAQRVGQNRLFALLDERYGWIKRAVGDGRYRVIQSAIESGYHPKTGVLVLDAPQPRVTPKGVQRILVDHGGAA